MDWLRELDAAQKERLDLNRIGDEDETTANHAQQATSMNTPASEETARRKLVYE